MDTEKGVSSMRQDQYYETEISNVLAQLNQIAGDFAETRGDFPDISEFMAYGLMSGGGLAAMSATITQYTSAMSAYASAVGAAVSQAATLEDAAAYTTDPELYNLYIQEAYLFGANLTADIGEAVGITNESVALAVEFMFLL
jgi:hypothetical protein